MLHRICKRLVVLVALAAPLAASARAQELGLTLSHRGEHGSFALTLGHGGGDLRFERRPRACERVWIPGRYETRCERVWVPGCTRSEWVPPRYEWRRDGCGRAWQVLVRPGFWHAVTEPGHYELRRETVWVPGEWRSAAR